MVNFKICLSAITLLLTLINFKADAQHSVGRAPLTESAKSYTNINSSVEMPAIGNALSLLSYGCYSDIANSVNKFASISLPSGIPFTDIGPGFGETLIQGSDFGPNGVLYAVSTPNILVSINLTNGTRSTVATITGTTGTITSLAYNEVTQQMYLGTTTTIISNLYTLNIANGAASLVGSISNCPVLITLAINCSGLAYGIDIASDVLLSVNLSNAAGTVIGTLGFNANYAQDADFDPDDGTLYFASYNNATSSGELRIVNITSGLSTLITSWGAREVTAFAVSGSCFRNNDVSAGPFKTFPSEFVINNAYTIKSAVRNPGLLNQQNFPVKCFVNENLVSTLNISLNSGQEDSVSFNWTPATTGSYNLKIVTALDSDENRNNDTVRASVNVYGSSTQVLFSDSFSNGLGNWSIINNGGNCDWQIYSPPYPNSYTLPLSSSAEVLAADSDECGENTTLLSTASLINNINCSGKENIRLSWDNDWRHLSSGIARVEVSYNSGADWSNVVEWAAVSKRNSKETFELPGAINNPNVKVRFVSVQPEWSWWWVIDNVEITGNDIILNSNQSSGEIPTEFTLSQNYPNPFNPSTKISFEIPVSGNVGLSVYDISGKVIAVLLNEYLQAGNHVIEFNAQKNLSEYSSGIYFYKLVTKHGSITKSMLMLK